MLAEIRDFMQSQGKRCKTGKMVETHKINVSS